MSSRPGAEILSTHTPKLFQAAVQRATDLLCAGEVVALPTETVYGLAANALNARAVEKIFTVKGRPAHNPIIVHVASIDMARQCVADWPRLGDTLARAFWPGPLTLVLPRSRNIPDVVTASGSTVGIRWPLHPLIQAVISNCGFPLAAPSANLSNRISPTTAEHVRRQLGNRVPLIIDGGRSQIGIESTVLDISVSPPRLLRPGMVHEQALLSVIGELQTCENDRGGILKSPGRLPRHYSPKARLVLWAWKNEKDLRDQFAQLTRINSRHPPQLSKCHVIVHTVIPSGEGFGRVAVIPHDPEAFARAIYAELHQCDEGGAELIVVEAPPGGIEWRAISDRLKRAAAELSEP